MKKWYEGSNMIQCDLEKIRSSFNDFGQHYAGVVQHMPGLAGVELIEQGDDYIVIKTNEGTMNRTNIMKQENEDLLVIEFDENYAASKLVTATSHYISRFEKNGSNVKHDLIIGDVKADGFIGFVYKTFAKTSIGNATLKAYKTYFESKDY